MDDWMARNSLNRHSLLRGIHDACQAVEVCGASVALTAAVTKVGDLMEPVRVLLDERDSLRAEAAQARAERDEWQARATRAEIAQVEARMQDISERQAESVLQAIEDRGLVTWATERDILIRRAEQAEATITTLRAELQAAQASQREWNALHDDDEA